MLKFRAFIETLLKPEIIESDVFKFFIKVTSQFSGCMGAYNPQCEED